MDVGVQGASSEKPSKPPATLACHPGGETPGSSRSPRLAILRAVTRVPNRRSMPPPSRVSEQRGGRRPLEYASKRCDGTSLVSIDIKYLTLINLTVRVVVKYTVT